MDIAGLSVPVDRVVFLRGTHRVRVDVPVVRAHVPHGHDPGRRGQTRGRSALGGSDIGVLEAAGRVQTNAYVVRHTVAGVARRERTDGRGDVRRLAAVDCRRGVRVTARATRRVSHRGLGRVI